MSIDNREQLFPDVIENYGPARSLPGSGDPDSVIPDFPIPEEIFRGPAPVYDVDDGVPAAEESAADAVVEFDLEPIAEPAPPEPAYVETVVFEPQEIPEPDETEPCITDDPYQHAPDWVRTHIPRSALLAAPSRSRGLRRRRPEIEPDAADVTGAAAPPTGPARRRSPLAVAGAVAASVAVVGGIGVSAVLAVTGSSQSTGTTMRASAPATALTTSSTPAAPAAAAASTWCAPVNTADQVTGNGSGGRDSGPAVIEAFEYAYYGTRNGATVADLMVTPPAITDIQSSIDAVPAGTEHCVTVLSTDDPNRWSVDILLKMPPSGTEGIHQQWITTVALEDGLKIEKVENR